MYKDYDPTRLWDNYEAWQLLRKCPKFTSTYFTKKGAGEADAGAAVDVLEEDEPPAVETPVPVLILAPSDAARSTGTTSDTTSVLSYITQAPDNKENNLVVGRPSRSAGRAVGKKKALENEAKRKHENFKHSSIQKLTDILADRNKIQKQATDMIAWKTKISELKSLFTVCEKSNPELAAKAQAKLIKMTAASILEDDDAGASPAASSGFFVSTAPSVGDPTARLFHGPDPPTVDVPATSMSTSVCLVSCLVCFTVD